jgi:hypothetical protein
LVNPQLDSFGGCLTRVVWMVLGNGALFMLAIVIYQQPCRPLSWRDGSGAHGTGKNGVRSR